MRRSCLLWRIAAGQPGRAAAFLRRRFFTTVTIVRLPPALPGWAADPSGTGCCASTCRWRRPPWERICARPMGDAQPPAPTARTKLGRRRRSGDLVAGGGGQRAEKQHHPPLGKAGHPSGSTHGQRPSPPLSAAPSAPGRARRCPCPAPPVFKCRPPPPSCRCYPAGPNATRWTTSGASCATTGSPTPSSKATRTSPTRSWPHGSNLRPVV